MDEETASTTILLETRGGKVKRDPLALASACKFFVDRQHGSYDDASKYIYNHYKYRISERTIRRLASLLRLPEEVQQQLLRGEIKIDVATQLSESKLDDKAKIKVGKVVSGMLAHDAREIIQFATKFPEADIEEYKDRVLAAKPEKAKLFVAVIPLNEENYRKLNEESQERKISLHELCSKIIEEWLNAREKGK
jgi:hypothetical protein